MKKYSGFWGAIILTSAHGCTILTHNSMSSKIMPQIVEYVACVVEKVPDKMPYFAQDPRGREMASIGKGAKQMGVAKSKVLTVELLVTL